MKKVFVGMSGGVDSSLAASLLKEGGYDVTGVFIKVWQPEGFSCTWREDRLDAMRVAAQLEIPFITLNLESEYKKGVIDYMLSEYKNGRTPNPDVMCNKTVKFGAFLKWAISRGADYIATGHYARINHKTNKLLSGVDNDKDQTYFLWTLQNALLKNILFPIGEFQKETVREMSKKRGLFTADKKDSQGLCFIGKLNIKDFLKEFINSEEGDVINENGDIIGKHDGTIFFTNGQRHGFTTHKTSTSEKPYYVIDRDIKHNTITVAHKKGDRISKKPSQIILSNINFTSGKVAKDLSNIFVRVRYRQQLQKAHFYSKENKIVFEKPQTVSAGQSAVMYDGDIVIGGGIIENQT